MLELSKTEKRTYSIRAAIASLLEGGQGHLSGLEKECHDEIQKSFPHRSNGALIPAALFDVRRNWKRDLTAGTFGSGGAFVPTIVEDELIPVLRNKLAVQRLGARVIQGLTGNVAIPRQSGASTVYTLPETTALTASTQAVDQVFLTPHRVGAFTNYSRQLVLQASVDVEGFVRDDLNAQVAVKLDYLCLQGQGANSEPLGILNTTGIGSLGFGGTATWAEVVSFEQSLAASNADQGRMGWCVSTAVRSKWKVVAKTGVGVTSVVPVFLWPENSPFNDGSNDGRVNGYRAAATNNILNNLVFFGNWEDLVLGQFGEGLEITVNPYTLATQAMVQVVVNTYVDVAVRRPASFCVSNDSGAQ